MNKEGMIIVMADENLQDHDLVKKAARECDINHVFTSVYNGAQLMDLLNKKGVYYTPADVAPDLILLEADLPVISGFDVMAKIRKDPKLRNIPVYFLTRKNDEETKKKALASGAAGYYIKPVEYQDLMQIIREICSEHFNKE